MTTKNPIYSYFLKIKIILVLLGVFNSTDIMAKIISNNTDKTNPTYYQPLAMINDSPITPFDVEKRAKFLRIINKIPDNINLTQYDKNKILDGLIEEKIKHQETERFKITIDDDRINNAFKISARNLGFSEKVLSEKFLKAGIDRHYFDAVTADRMAWEELVQGRYARDITVSTYEIAQIIEANALTENLSIIYNEISLPFDNSQESKQKIQETLDIIAKKLRAGEAFFDIAKNYDANSVRKTQLLSEINPNIAKNLLSMQSEQISQPIQTLNSVVIVQFIDKQKGDTSVINQKMTIKSGRLDFDTEKTEQEKQHLIQKINNNPKLCKNYANYINDVTVFNNVTIAELPESLRAVAKTAKQGETRIVREADASYYVLTLCDIKKPDYYNDVSEEVRNKTRNQIFTHKLSLKDQEYYRTLKKHAVITLFQ